MMYEQNQHELLPRAAMNRQTVDNYAFDGIIQRHKIVLYARMKTFRKRGAAIPAFMRYRANNNIFSS